jgi:acid phosphatase
MANAIKKISVQRGHDVTRYALCCFGGAAGQHACLVADALAMTQVFIHPHAGVLSALGMGLADQSVMREQAIEVVLGEHRLPQLDAALADPSWTAALEQQGDASRLPPAVVVDIDETVLDNSYYQARLIRDNSVYATPSWDAWVAEARATAVPGAVEFSKYAASKGVTIFYVSNRTANLEEATRKNLAALGFPLPVGIDTILVRGERPDWATSAKGARRAFIAANYRIVMLIGDDLGDFVVDASGTPAERSARTSAQSDWWGRRWIMIPNPTYGSWERAILGNAKDPIAARRAALKYQPADKQP